MNTTVPLHEAVRPAGNRDDAGTVGESLHALADWLEKHKPEVSVSEQPNRKTLKDAVFACRPPIAGYNHRSALNRNTRKARD